MKKMNLKLREPCQPEPRWPSAAALGAVAVLHYALPSALSPGPDWLVPLLVLAFTTPALISHRIRAYRAAQVFGYVALCTVTVMTLASLGLLVAGLPSHKETPLQLLISAACLWASNVLIFASWYWRLDAGGPHQRDLRGAHTDGAFLFPQMMLDLELREQMGEQDWRPGFVDYLFLAFNTSTAFSPTDVPVLSRWAKVLMMLQAAISLATLAILAARAVNIL
ncbi:MAG TPA: hypothetical protein VEV85_07745 [Bryobacteraceae bacterium]|jgi:hypothetical protein|nr:hypothetical protein [Bryobacteraceae bacterium]